MARFTPAQLEQALFDKPEELPTTMRTLGAAISTRDAKLRESLTAYLASVAAARAKRVAATPVNNGMRDLTALLMVDPVRFLKDAEFRSRVLPRVTVVLESAALREAFLRDINAAGADFDTFETLATTWGMVRVNRRNDPWSATVSHDLSSPIEASIYSINSQFFPDAADARAFLSAVRASAPKRRLLVLADATMAAALKDLDVEIVPTFSRFYTPWPRDPFSVARAKSGEVVLINRPNLQPEREEDANMARALVHSGALNATWGVAKVPFHNGHMLVMPEATWISIHTVEIRALEILGLKRVPSETFGTKQGIEKYIAAVRQAADELEQLFGRDVRFVHPLEPDPALFKRLAGGGGHDLDSLVTILPPDHAIVGDITLGAKYTVPAVYGGKAVPAPALDAYLDTIAASLKSRGMTVHRLPMILVSGKPKPFLLNWNNVVLETKRAEGFASLIEPADALARATFAKAGYELELFPPLVKSVRHGGGYRCASNHVRP